MQQYRGQIIGKAGEQAARRWYEQRGYTLEGSNVRGVAGEVDLIMRRGTAVHMVEVKTRSSLHYGAAEAVTPRKMHRMRKVAAQWLREHPGGQVQFDVVEIVGGRCVVYEAVDRGAC